MPGISTSAVPIGWRPSPTFWPFRSTLQNQNLGWLQFPSICRSTLRRERMVGS